MQTNKKRIYLGVANYSGCQNQLCPQFSLHLSLHSWSAHFHCQLLLNQELKIQQKGEQKKQIKLFGARILFSTIQEQYRIGARSTVDAIGMRMSASPSLTLTRD
jgi:hypothetical protein